MPSKHAGSNSEGFWLCQLWPLWPTSSQNWLDCIHARSTFPHLIQFHSSKEGPDRIVKKLTRIQSGWPGEALAKQIWSGSKTVCQNHQACFWQNATSLIPVSHFQTQLHSSAVGQNHIVQTSLDPIWLWLTIPGLGKISQVQKQACVQESL